MIWYEALNTCDIIFLIIPLRFTVSIYTLADFIYR